LKWAHYGFFRGEKADIAVSLRREQSDISFLGMSGIPRLNIVRKGLRGQVTHRCHKREFLPR
jgi:hypothetical protein